MKLIFLGNEFIEEDSLAKKIGESLQEDFDVVNIKDSFQLMSLLNEFSSEEIILVDIIRGLKKAQIISSDDLRNDSILSAHDFDAGYVLKLIDKPFKIIGIPAKGNFEKIKEEVLNLLS